MTQSVITISKENFPDDNFRAFILSNVEKDGDGVLNEEEINNTRYINVSSCEIRSLQGIQFFTELVELNCSCNEITSLDVSANKNLEILDCMVNNISSLNVKGCTRLKELSCGNNPISKLELIRCRSLIKLNCMEADKLTSIDVRDCERLQMLYCSETALKDIDVSFNPVLRVLDCYDSPVSYIEIGNSEALLQAFKDCKEPVFIKEDGVIYWNDEGALLSVDLSTIVITSSLDIKICMASA